MPDLMQNIRLLSKAIPVTYELRKGGVSVMALALGYVDAAFAGSAGLHDTKLVKTGGKSAASVARHRYDAMLRGSWCR